MTGVAVVPSHRAKRRRRDVGRYRLPADLIRRWSTGDGRCRFAGDADAEFVKTVITRHGEEISPRVAEALLGDWPATVTIHQDHAEGPPPVLMAQARAEAEGRNVDEAIMEASRG